MGLEQTVQRTKQQQPLRKNTTMFCLSLGKRTMKKLMVAAAMQLDTIHNIHDIYIIIHTAGFPIN
jgi:hypothetical protein